MIHKTKFFFKWTFVFSVLSIWTFLVVQSIAFGSADTGPFSPNFNIPIYLQTSAGIEKASSTDIISFLFNHDFDIETKTQIISDEKCSLKGKDGSLVFNGDVFQNSKLSFSINHLANGGGTITSQKGRERINIKFTPINFTQVTTDTLSFNAEGTARINRNAITMSVIHVFLDKETQKVTITGSGDDNNFELNNAEATFIEGCLSQEEEFYLLVDHGERSKRRSIEEVRQLLTDHPELIDAYEGLRRLFSDAWFLAIPGGIISG